VKMSPEWRKGGRQLNDRVLARPCRAKGDLERVRSLLVETYSAVKPGWNWDIRRWDGWRSHREEPLSDAQLAKQVGLWETQTGRLVGAVHPEGYGEAFLELHPDFRHLETEMVCWAEEHLAATTSDGQRTLDLWVGDDDARRSLLESVGYRMLASGGWHRRLRFGDCEPASRDRPSLYTFRQTELSDDDCARMARLLNAAFGRTCHTAREYRTFMDRSPSFDQELNLVAVNLDGSFAAHAGATYDAFNRHGILEPVCTHEDHRRLGLAQALILECLRRLQARGAETASVETGDGTPTNRLYEACGFTDGYHSHLWRRYLYQRARGIRTHSNNLRDRGLARAGPGSSGRIAPG
jgi:mycothiol synthase